ncbi:hypothetical protein [Tepidibacter thalassicus]|uniref:Uncharacterized protein n=1 Tax=Tepidibacter thalassicus DSM 15285 TaxID=1123350 RepID=A0A1M5TXG9_9FIRM|nr:hypothetical protein [Tepidibacter thalassicus]SHH55388.1 hypothetical protein SAMN02744040_02330 [Tepidibacter thalassicus DSM 15285]
MDKIDKILDLQEQGYTRQQIAKKLGYKRLDSMTRYLKKHGYILVDGKYVLDANTKNNTNIVNTETNTISNTLEVIDVNTVTNTQTNTREQFVKVLDNKIIELLRSDYNILKEMIDRFKKNMEVHNSSNIAIDLIDDRHLKQYPKAVRVNEFVWKDWTKFCVEHNKFSKKELISMALKEYMEKHK